MATLIDSVALNNVVEEEIEIEYNGKTEHWIDYFQGSGPQAFFALARRASDSFRDIIEPILVDVGIPAGSSLPRRHRKRPQPERRSRT